MIKRSMSKIGSWYMSWATTLDSAGKDSRPAQAKLKVHETAMILEETLDDAIRCGTNMDSLKRHVFYGQPLDKVWVNFDNNRSDSREAQARMQNHNVVMLLHACMGFVTEAGEILENLRDHIYKGTKINWVNIFEELGDLCWYVAIAAKACGLRSILPILRANYRKLTQRYGEEWDRDRARVRDKEKEMELVAEEFFNSTNALTAGAYNGQNTLYYLSSPFRCDDEMLRNERYEQTALALTSLMNKGKHVFSPIIHNSPIKRIADLGSSWEDWEQFDLDMLSRCDAVMVLKIDGWERSVGVQAEIDYAQTNNIPIYYTDPVSLEEVMQEARNRAVRKAGGPLYQHPFPDEAQPLNKEAADHFDRILQRRVGIGRGTEVADKD
jgi:NTP pyrophosphatase (non-canonical NTP hydrolase)